MQYPQKRKNVRLFFFTVRFIGQYVLYPVITNKFREDTNMTRNMNTAKIIRFRDRRGPAYPNAAERRYYINKALDYTISLVGAAGAVSALLLLFVLL